MMTTFGEKLKSLRKAVGLSQIELANDLKDRLDYSISQTKVSSLEKLDKAPREEILLIFVNYFDVPVSYFYEEEKVDRDKVETAKDYLRSLQNLPFEGRPNFAHSTKHRTENDNVSQSLEQLGSDFEEDEFLGS